LTLIQHFDRLAWAMAAQEPSAAPDRGRITGFARREGVASGSGRWAWLFGQAGRPLAGAALSPRAVWCL